MLTMLKFFAVLDIEGDERRYDRARGNRIEAECTKIFTFLKSRMTEREYQTEDFKEEIDRNSGSRNHEYKGLYGFYWRVEDSFKALTQGRS